MIKAFTLIEVAVAGSLIGLCVLTAVSIIPQGLRAQDEGRMKAAAAAEIMTLSAKAYALDPNKSCMDVSLVSVYMLADPALSPPMATPTNTPGSINTTRLLPPPSTDPTTGLSLPPYGVNLQWFYNSSSLYTSRIDVASDLRFESSGAVVSAPAALYIKNPMPAIGELERRILFSYSDGTNGDSPPQNTRTITAWLLNADPVLVRFKSTISARYLGTYNEKRP